MKNALKTLFKIKPGEEYLVGLNFLQAVFLGFPRLFTLTAANSLFLENYSASHLPYIYIASNLIVPIIGITYLYFEKRISFIKLQKGALLGLGLILTGLFMLLWWLPNLKWPTFVLLIWFDSEWMLALLLYWSVANRLFTLRQGKRLFGLIWSGEILTVLVGGFLMPYLVQFIGTVNLLLLSIGGLILALINLTYMNHVFKSKLSETVNQHNFKDDAPAKNGLISVFKNRYTALIFAVLVIYAYMIFFFVDNLFYYQLNKQYQNAEQLAGFIGQFLALYSILSLFFRAVLSGRWIMRVGLLGGLLTLPIMLSIGVIFAISIDYLLNEVLLVFWLIVLLKLIDRVLVGAIFFPSYYTLYQPLPTQQRTRIQTSIEIVAGPFVGIFAGTFLLLLQQYFDLTSLGLSVVLLLLLFIFIVIGFLTFNEYRKALATALSHKSLADIDLPLNEIETVNLLEQGLKSPRSEEVLYCLKLLEQADYPNIKDVLLTLITHRNSDVRKGVYQSIEKLGDPDYFKPLKQRLVVEEIPAIRAALLGALAATGEDEAFDIIQPYLNEARLELRQAAMVALIRYGGIDGVVTAGGDLKALKDSPKASDRAFAAQVLGNIGISNFYRWLLPLLRDNALEVRKAALIAASRLDNPKLWPLVVENLEWGEVRKECLQALNQAGESAFGALEAAYQSQSVLVRRQIILMYGRIKGQAAIRLLVKTCDETDNPLRDDILWALHFCHYQVDDKNQAVIEQRLQHERAYGLKLIDGLKVLMAQQNLTVKADDELLYTALQDELEKTRTRLFLRLSFIYPSESMMKIRSHLSSATQAEKRDMAIELFEQIVNKKHKLLVLPILRVDFKCIPPILESPLELVAFLKEILCQPDSWNNSWVKACAIDVGVKIARRELRSSIEPLINDSEALIRETAQYAMAIPNERPPIHWPLIEKVKLLQWVEIFAEIPGEVLAEIATLLEYFQLDEGESLFLQGEQGDSLYIVAEGLLQMDNQAGTPLKLGKGAIVGELLSVLVQEPRCASVLALKKSYLLQLSRLQLQRLMSTKIEVARGIMQLIYYRLEALQKQTKCVPSRPNPKPVIEQKPQRFQPREPLSFIEKVMVLKTVSIFSTVPENNLLEIARFTQEVSLEKDKVLFNPSHLETHMYIIVQGRVKVYNDEPLFVELGERETIGELSALFSEPQTVSVAAIEDTRLLSLSQEVIFELIWERHDVVQAIIQVLVQRLRHL